MEGSTWCSGTPCKWLISSGDNVASEEFKVKFEKFVTDENLQPYQVYNADEKELNYKMLPKTLAPKLDSVAKHHKKKKTSTFADRKICTFSWFSINHKNLCG